MHQEKTFWEKYYLFFIFLIATGVDCFFIYRHNNYARFYAKPLEMISLIVFFFNNTAFNIQSSAETFGARASFYTYAFFTLLADIGGFYSKQMIGVACLFSYMLSDICLIYVLFTVQQFAPKEMRFHLHVSKLWIPLIAMTILCVAVIHKTAGFQTTPFHISVYVHSLILTTIALMGANMYGVKETKSLRLLFAIGIVFMINANMLYAFDELIFHESRPPFSVAVTVVNNLGFMFITFGVIKFIRLKKG